MKRIHHAMWGRPVSLDEHDLRTYLDQNRRCAAMLDNEWDVVVVHDPQPAALIASAAAPSAAWVWRCHIDASAPDPAVWELLRAFVIGYDAFVFTLPEFCPPDLDRERLAVIAPAIDPLAAKNRPLPRELAEADKEGRRLHQCGRNRRQASRRLLKRMVYVAVPNPAGT